MNLQNFLSGLNIVTIWGMLALMFIYWFRLLYILYAFTKDEPAPSTDKRYRYAVLIPARNESRVIANLLHSIKKQDYPAELIDVYVIVEDEKDPTVEIVKNFGYNTVVRPSLEGRRTKGYALDDAISYIKARGESYGSYFIFDADNLLSVDFISKMNAMKASGVKLGMGYRSSKNANENLIAGCSHTLFLFLNTLTSKGRSRFANKIVLSGTGYFLDSDIVEQAGGFIWNGLTEDCELSLWCCEHNIKCAYNTDAVFYDEQATTYKQTNKQHIRWLWGHFAAEKKYHKKIRKAFFTQKGEKFAKMDILIGLTPLILMLILLAANIIISSVLGVACMLEGNILFKEFFKNAIKVILCTYIFFSVMTIMTFIADHKHRSFGAFHALKIALVFPIYMANFVIAFFKGLNKKNLTWQPIEHKGQSDAVVSKTQTQSVENANDDENENLNTNEI